MNPVSGWWKVIRTYRAEPRFVPRLALYGFKVAVFEPLRWLEKLNPRLRSEGNALPHPPVFILGYYRSGTTHLQEVMLQDPQFAYMNFYQCFFPTAFNSTQKWVQPVFEAIMSRSGFLHPAHQIPFSFDLPAEEDVAMLTTGFRYAANWGAVYQRDFKEIYAKTALLDGTPEEIAEFRGVLHDLIFRVSRANGDKKLLLKSPPHTGRLKLLRAMYPDAKFVFIRRHPHEVYMSNLKLWKSFDFNRVQTITADDVREYILWSHDRTHENYERDKVGLRDDQLVEVSFEDFMAEPMSVLETIYRTLDLAPFDTVTDAFRAYLDANHQQPDPYTLSDEQVAAIEARLGGWMQKWGYGTPAKAAV